MKKLYLHLGLHKTATTSFQNGCGYNINKLKTQGYIYPLFNFIGKEKCYGIINHGESIVSLFHPNPAKTFSNIRLGALDVDVINKNYMRVLMESLAGEANVILSGEGIAGGLSEEALNNFLVFLQNSGVEVIPFICVRTPYDFHCSMKQQYVKNGIYVNFSALQPQVYIMAKLKKIFGERLTVFPFSRACAHPRGPAAFLLEWIGVDITKIKLRVANESWSNLSTRVQNEINKKSPAILQEKLNPDHFSIRNFFKGGSKFLLTPEEFGAIKEDLDAENNFWRENYGEEFCDKTIRTTRFTVKEEWLFKHYNMFVPLMKLSDRARSWKIVRPLRWFVHKCRYWRKIYG